MSWYNVVTLKNLNISSTIENRTIVCGSLISDCSSHFGTKLNIAKFPNREYSLEIVDRIFPGDAINVHVGSLCVFDNGVKRFQKQKNSVDYIVDGRHVNMLAGPSNSIVFAEDNLEMKCGVVSDSTFGLSRRLQGFPVLKKNSVSVPTTNRDKLIFKVNTVNDDNFAVFHQSAEHIFNNPQVSQIDMVSTVKTLEYLIINLSGEHIIFDSGTFTNSWFATTEGRLKTIWHFYEAIQIELNQEWFGTLLAPNAIVTTDQIINGVVIVNSLNTTNIVRDSYLNFPYYKNQCH